MLSQLLLNLLHTNQSHSHIAGGSSCDAVVRASPPPAAHCTLPQLHSAPCVAVPVLRRWMVDGIQRLRRSMTKGGPLSETRFGTVLGVVRGGDLGVAVEGVESGWNLKAFWLWEANSRVCVMWTSPFFLA